MALTTGFRRFMLFGAILVFVAATYILLLYAQGLTFSFKDREFVLTGALTINANEQVDVFLDGELSGSTSVITNEFNRGRIHDRELGRGVLGYQESKDSAKLLWWTRNEIIVMWLQDTSYQPFRLAGEIETITRISTSIARATWWPDNYHIAFRTGTHYRVVELDNRGGTNTIEL
jgi:hypothetical protein